MLKISELNKRTSERKKRKRRNIKTSVTSRRVKDDGLRRARAERTKKKVELLRAEAEKIGKISASGKRICMWDGCTTILSLYNSDRCCSRHQAAWNLRNCSGAIFD